MTDPQTLNATEATVLRAIHSYFERNPYETKVQFIDLIVDLNGRLVAGKLKPVVEHLIHLGCLWGSTKNTLELTARGLSSLEVLKLHSEDSFSHFCDLLVVALANHAEQQATKFDAFDLRAIAELYALEFTPGWIEGASEVFEKREWAKIKRFSDSEEGGMISAALTGPGLLEAERLRGRLINQGVVPPTYPPSVDTSSVKTSASLSAGTAPHSASGNTLGSFSPSAFAFSTNSAPTIIAEDTDSAGPIPAADRFVTRSDNAPLFERAEQELEALTEAVRAANDLRVTADERLAIISEVEGISSLLKQPAVRARAIYDAVRENSLLRWLAGAAGTGVVGHLAVAAVNALLALVGL